MDKEITSVPGTMRERVVLLVACPTQRYLAGWLGPAGKPTPTVGTVGEFTIVGAAIPTTQTTLDFVSAAEMQRLFPYHAGPATQREVVAVGGGAP